MKSDLQYIVDDSGNKQSVLVPLKMWEELNSNYVKLQKKLEVFKQVQSGLEEVQSTRNTGKKLQTLKDFLSESNS